MGILRAKTQLDAHRRAACVFWQSFQSLPDPSRGIDRRNDETGVQELTRLCDAHNLGKTRVTEVFCASKTDEHHKEWLGRKPVDRIAKHVAVHLGLARVVGATRESLTHKPDQYLSASILVEQEQADKVWHRPEPFRR